MSNVIKAAAVTYTQEIRTIDSNLREGGFTRLTVDKLAQVKEEEEGKKAEFEPGIFGLFVDQNNAKNSEQADDTAAALAKIQEEVEQKKQEVQEILAQAREEVKAMLSAAQTDADAIRKKAYEDGLRQGEKKAQEKYDAMRVRLEREVQEAKESYERQVQELEPSFVDILIQLLRKLTGVLVEDRREIIVYLMKQALREIEPGMTYLVHVSPEDFAMANAGKTRLLEYLKDGATLEVIKDRTMQKGQCIIETESRIFDCSIDTQLRNLAGDLKLLAGVKEG